MQGKEYAETGITVNALAPAVIQTPMVDVDATEQVKYMTDKIPMKRCGTLDEIAHMAAFIVSRETAFTTGFTFDMTRRQGHYHLTVTDWALVVEQLTRVWLCTGCQELRLP